MKLKYVEMSFSEMLVLKQRSQEQKILFLRNMSEEERSAINERSVDLCQKIASEFRKSRRLVLK
ncbi:MAG: hypothetical protein ACN6O6_17905 [Pseudomonas sp.]|jgi:hypothetical protein|uniref:hypothetical protein n=1 Tax=Pseudomonas sp. TaxID=306 RepID=UPI003D0C8218